MPPIKSTTLVFCSDRKGDTFAWETVCGTTIHEVAGDIASGQISFPVARVLCIEVALAPTVEDVTADVAGLVCDKIDGDENAPDEAVEFAERFAKYNHARACRIAREGRALDIKQGIAVGWN